MSNKIEQNLELVLGVRPENFFNFGVKRDLFFIFFLSQTKDNT